LPKSIELAEKKAIFQRLRANTAKFAGKNFEIKSVEFLINVLFKLKNSKLAISQWKSKMNAVFNLIVLVYKSEPIGQSPILDQTTL